jgi:hypothetical protein
MKILAYLSCAILTLLLVWTLGFGCQAIYTQSFWLKGTVGILERDIAAGEEGREKVAQDLVRLRRHIGSMGERELVGNIAAVVTILALLVPMTYIVKAQHRLDAAADRT